MLTKAPFHKSGYDRLSSSVFAVPSALSGLTSLFGMGRGGSPTLSIALIRVLMPCISYNVRVFLSRFRHGNCVFFSIRFFLLLVAANTEGMAQSIDSLHSFECGAKKALGQLVLLD